jgi:hypothetical protein
MLGSNNFFVEWIVGKHLLLPSKVDLIQQRQCDLYLLLENLFLFKAIISKSFKREQGSKITVNVGDHNRQGLIERFNRTLESLISIYQESRNTNRYIDVLEDIVHNYNHSHHRGINDTPESRYQTNPKTGTIQTKALNNQIKIGKSAF